MRRGLQAAVEADGAVQAIVIMAQAALLVEQGNSVVADAFIASRFDPEWGAVSGIAAGGTDSSALLRAVWQ